MNKSSFFNDQLNKLFIVEEANEYLGTDKIINKSKPIVSVSVATYQHENYIRQCLDGILKQKTAFEYEVIIGEDESDDNTRFICLEYANKYPDKIRLFLRNRKTSQCFLNNEFLGRFNGIWNRMSSRGKYIAMCEGDDYWTDPLKLQKQVDFLEKNKEYGMVHTNFDTYYQNKNYFLENTHSVFNIDLKDDCTLDYWNFFGKEMATIKTLTVCFRNDLLKKWQSTSPKNNWLIGDFPMYFYISLQSKVGYINESTSVYRSVPQGSASNVGKDNIKKLKIRKTYVDIRLYFLNHFKLNKNDYLDALLRDLQILLDYCIINNDEITLKNYIKIINNLGFDESILTKLFLKLNNSTIKNLICKLTKLKLWASIFFYKLKNTSFLIKSIERHLNFRNV